MNTTYRELRSAVDWVVTCEDAVEKAGNDLIAAEARLGKALRACREYRKLSLRHCAKAIGVSAPYLGDVENGKRTISTGNLELLMGVLMTVKQL